MAKAAEERLMEALRRPGVAAAAVLVIAVGSMGLATYGARFLVEHQVSRREARVVKTLGTLGDALQAYQQQFGGYPDSLMRLRGKEESTGGPVQPEHARLLGASLARDRFEEYDYLFTYTPIGPGQTWAASVPLVKAYVLEARPLGPAMSKTGFYYADQAGAVRVKRGGPAGKEDAPAQ